ncbi:ABC transporter ATP-binding protein [Paludicola sp. MB14-C6]|uniref:ABC transporter ATP-binding protein n=1 Tax=Paludihabitans sp. MB14-C6 TaxID=3070656 RepID=UPI0027DC2037|nr:ABC transporter ATP-binding protein [Paludicola sp. MB14-C6]WMJ23658.1 ABC transporter ATP-binding protein [Paludicola sp. MB14-C6]
MIKRFLSYYKPHWKLFAFDIVCSFVVAGCDLFFPSITGNIIDDYIPNKNIRLLVIWSIALLAIFILKAALNYFIQYYGHCVGVRMQADMRRDIFKHMQKLPFTFFDSHKTGSIMSRIINDLMEVSELAHHGPEDLFVSSVMLISSFIILCFISLPLTLIIFAIVPLLVWFAAKMRKRMMNAFTATREEISEINASLESSISGIRVSKAFTNSEHEEKKFEKNNKSFKKAREFAYKTMSEFHSGMGLLTDFLNLVVMFGGGLYAYWGYITPGEFVKYLLYINMFLMPIRKIIGFIEQYQNGMSGFKRFIEILDSEPERETENAKDIENVQGSITFKDVSFNYEEGKDILNHINLTIEKGNTVAFVGPSGGGKTTLCHLIPRFYDINSGEISIDGINILNFTYESLRKNIGIVQQDVFLFTGTIWDNIAYGNLDASEDDIITAAKMANIHDFVMSLDDQYDTYIGERGVKLSGGQKQRLSIARLFLKNPPILILDEATSALDNTTELLIQESLEKLSANKTTLVVAHRLSTIKNADMIVVLTDNGIEEQGTHEELLALNGIYKELYDSQFKLNA